MQNNWKMTETPAIGSHLRVLNKSYPMNTNMTGFRWVSKPSRPFALDESSLSMGRDNPYAANG